MSSFRYHEEITTFLKQVCREIKAKEVHAEVRQELESHLQDLIEEKLSNGVDLNTSVKESIAQMGTPDVIGKQFHQAHRPRFNWGLLAVVVLFMAVGLIAIFSAQSAIVSRIGANSIGQKQLVYLGVGSCLMLVIGWSNYSQFAKYSWGLYAGAIALLSYVYLFGNLTNGSRGYVNWYPFQMNIPAITPYLLLIAIAGIWSTPPRIVANESIVQAMLRKSWINVGIVWLPSLLILATHSSSNFILFFIGCLTLLLVLKKKRTILVAHCSLFVAAIILFILKLSLSYQSYQLQRLLSFTHPKEDPQGANYLLTQSKHAIQSSGWLGHGFGAPIKTLPELHAEMMFPFLIYCFGWAAGIAIVMMIAMFVRQTVGVTRKVKDPYGKAIVSGLLSVFVAQFLWSIFMSIGLVPISAFQLPFISYTGSLVIFQFIAVGLMLSVYRRKDLGTRQFT